jgi:hypothetical protein
MLDYSPSYIRKAVYTMMVRSKFKGVVNGRNDLLDGHKHNTNSHSRENGDPVGEKLYGLLKDAVVQAPHCAYRGMKGPQDSKRWCVYRGPHWVST